MQNKKTIKKVTSDEKILNAGLIFLFFSAVGSIFNYLYHLFMGRMLGPEQYGILGSLFAIIYIVSFSTSTFNLVISKHVAEFSAKDEKRKIKSLFQRAFKKTIIFGIIGLGIYFLFIPLIASFMNITSYLGLIIVGIIAYFSFITILFIGTLNGLQKFVWQNCSNTFSTFLKLAVAVILVYLGFSVGGALTGILVGTIAAVFIAYIPIKKEFKNIKPERFDAKSVYFYAVPVFLASILSVLMITFDQILVKHYFSSADAGIYAAAGMIGKIIWFGSSALIGPLFPKIVSLKSKSRSKDASKLLIKVLVYTATLAIMGCIIFAIAPTFITNTLYGSQYIAAIPLILMFGIAMGLFALIQILMTYNLAIENYKFIYIFALALIAEVIGIIMFHSSLSDVVKVVLIANIFTIICLLIINREDLLNHISE
jgi:O-antigen/teichoic acid export membrane protein